MNRACVLLSLWATFLLLSPARALEPKDVFLLVNKNVAASRAVADHYCQKRGVPRDHVLELDLPDKEDVSRADYDDKIVAPVRAWLGERRDQAKVLVTTYGVPLRVGPRAPSAEQKKELEGLQADHSKQETEVKLLKQGLIKLEAAAIANATEEQKKGIESWRKQVAEAEQKLRQLQARQQNLSGWDTVACVDSELALLWWERYELSRWQPNLLNFQASEAERKGKPPIVLVSRLDGPTPAIAKRLVDDALAVEQTGLQGKVYVDARGIPFDKAKDQGFGYGGYDQSLRDMAQLLDKEAKLAVTLDNHNDLFAAGSCPDCALYCGWYALANYVPCCKFVRGAVAYHVASAEAVSLRDATRKYWCIGLLQDGVAATLGPVGEPYTIGFPKPAEFFGFLVTGEYTLVECYARTALLQSWMTVLVGDPLYNPFAKDKRLKVEQVKPSPMDGQPLFRRP